MQHRPSTIVDLLARAALTPDAGIRVLDRDNAATWLAWPEVHARALAACAWLQHIGVRRGDRVALVFPTEPAFFDAFFGVVLAGAIPVPLYPPVRLGRLNEYLAGTTSMVRAAGACLLLAGRRVYPLLGPVARDAAPRLGCRLLGAAPPSAACPVPANPADLALVQFSSGTTTAPKPIALTHAAIVWQAVTLNGFWPDDGSVKHSGVSWLPLYHDMGLIGCVMTAVERPGTVTLVPPELFIARPALWLQTISAYRASISPAPNFAYSVAAERVRDEELEGVDLSCWRIALCGAEAIVPDVLRAFARRFAPSGFRLEALTPVYGLSEAALAVTFSDPSTPFVARRFDRRALRNGGIVREAADGRELVSVGRPVAGFEVRVTDGDGTPVPEGGIGIVECRGSSVMEGYLDQPEATAEVLHDGWLSTGDLGFLWGGDLFLTGRRKDVLIVRGANHSPEEVEQAVMRIDGVRRGCAVAVSWLPEGSDGEQLVVFVEAARQVPRERFDAIAAECSRSIVAATSLTADRVVVVPPGTLLRTSSGKLRRQETLTRYLAGQLEPASPPTRWRLAAAAARSALAHAKARRDRR